MSSNAPHILYLCYFGLREPLVQTQVLPYLRQIHGGGMKVSLLTFEQDPKKRWTADEIDTERKKLDGEGIDWHYLTYHKRPSLPATMFDVLAGAFYSLKLARRHNVRILHARAHIPALIALIVKLFRPVDLIFDIRGLVAEEYVDSGIWKEGSPQFRLIKTVERLALKHASQVVVLTNRMKTYLVENGLKEASKIEVVPCCVDFSRIGELTSAKNARFELIYAGSTVGLYLLREMGMFFIELRKHKPDAFFRILTASPPENIRKIFDELEIDRADYGVESSSPAEVSSYLKKARVGISFRKPTFSQIAASPTKVPEYLSSGLPVVSNYGIGDTDEILNSERVGVCVREFSPAELQTAALEILDLLEEEDIANKCRAAARKYFDLETTGRSRYLSVYKKMI